MHTLRWIKRVGWAGLALGGIVAVTFWVQCALEVDPFARLREAPQDELQIGAELTNVALRQYRGPELISRAEVGKIVVRRDRQHFAMRDVRHGEYFGEKGQFEYSAASAEWDLLHEQMTATQGVRVWNADMDLQTQLLIYKRASGTLHAPETIQGGLRKGQVEARNFQYQIEDGSYTLGPVVWEGPVAFQEEGLPAAQAKWKLEGASASRKGDVEVWTDGKATDGEIIVEAPRIERNVKTDVLTATQGATYYSAKANVSASKVVVYRKEKRAVLPGNVQMLFKPKDQQAAPLKAVEIPPFRPMVPDEVLKSRPQAQASEEQKKRNEELRSGESLRKYPVAVTADRIEYWYGKGSRKAVITGDPQARQEMPGGRWRHIWTFKAFYDGEKETLRLQSPDDQRTTRIVTSLGDDLTAFWFEISTEEGKDEWSAQSLSGEVSTDEDEIPQEETSPPLRGDIRERPRT